MKEYRIFEGIGEVDEELLLRCEHMMKSGRKKKQFFFMAGLAACLVVAVGMATVFWMQGNGSRWPVKMVSYSYTNEYHENTTDIAVVKKWEERSLEEQYDTLWYQGVQYQSQMRQGEKNSLGDSLGEATLEGVDITTEENHRLDRQIYEIRGISPSCAVMADLSGEGKEYYVYLNHSYQPQTLGGFQKDLNLKANLRFGTIWWENYQKPNGQVATVEFTGEDPETLYELLFSKTEIPLAEGYYDSPEQMEDVSVVDISIDIPVLGYENISISLTQNGYLTTNILATGKAFYIGQEQVEAVVSYITGNCEGHELVFSSTTEFSTDESTVSHSVGNADVSREVSVGSEGTTKGYEGDAVASYEGTGASDVE